MNTRPGFLTCLFPFRHSCFLLLGDHIVQATLSAENNSFIFATFIGDILQELQPFVGLTLDFIWWAGMGKTSGLLRTISSFCKPSERLARTHWFAIRILPSKHPHIAWFLYRSRDCLLQDNGYLVGLVCYGKYSGRGGNTFRLSRRLLVRQAWTPPSFSKFVGL